MRNRHDFLVRSTPNNPKVLRLTQSSPFLLVLTQKRWLDSLVILGSVQQQLRHRIRGEAAVLQQPVTSPWRSNLRRPGTRGEVRKVFVAASMNPVRHDSTDATDLCVFCRLCNEKKPCPLPVLWTAWAPWAHCSAECGGGVQSRTRSCENGNTCPGCAMVLQSF